MDTPSSQQNNLKQTNRAPLGSIAVLLLAVLATTAIRVRLLSMPLERDEGEFAYGGQLILHGHPLYKHLYNMKWPGTYYCYALIEALFDETIQGVRLGVLVVNVVTTLLVFLIGRRLLDAGAAAAAAVAYAALSISPTNLAFMGHATHFVVMAALLAILFLLWAAERRKLGLYFLAGFFAGAAPIMKQPGLVFTAFVLSFWIWQEVYSVDGWPRQTLTRAAVLCGGVLCPFVLLLGSVWLTGTFKQFWLWTIKYPEFYGGPPTLIRALSNFVSGSSSGIGEGFLFWLLAGLGLFGLARHPQTRAAAPFLVGLLAFSFLGVFPGFIFREHYFILMLPAVALLVGAAVFLVRHQILVESPRLATLWAGVLVLVPFSVALGIESDFYFSMSPADACNYLYPGNGFVESVKIADFIRANSDPRERIAVIGSEPQIYFYSRRLAATGQIYTYALMEEQPFAHDFQEQMIAEIEAARPEYVIFVNLFSSWLPRQRSDKTLADWFNRYRTSNLKVAQVVKIDHARPTPYAFERGRDRKRVNVANLTVYRRAAPP